VSHSRSTSNARQVTDGKTKRVYQAGRYASRSGRIFEQVAERRMRKTFCAPAPCLPVHREAMGRSGCIRPLASKARQGRNTPSDEFHVFVFPSFTALPPLGQNCFCLRGLYDGRKTGISARARYPLDKVLRKNGNSAFRGVSAQRRRRGDANLAAGPLSEKGHCTCGHLSQLPRMRLG